MSGGGPLGEGGILRPIYQKYYEEVLGLDNPAVSATAIPVTNTFSLALFIVILNNLQF